MNGQTDTGAARVSQPYDLDRLVSRALNAITAVVVAGAMAWSTVAIGTLLHRMAPAWVSYGVAGVFDMSWVACMGAEWLMRYDRKRALVPKLAGWVALCVSVSSIVLEGYLTSGKVLIGCVGAVVSVLAKGLWMVVMTISSRRLAPADQQWYETARSAAEAQLAMVAIQRKLARETSRANQERAALAEFQGLPQVLTAPPAPAVSAAQAPTVSAPAVRPSAPVVPTQPVRPPVPAAPAPVSAPAPQPSVSAPVSAPVVPAASAPRTTVSVPVSAGGPSNVRQIGQATGLADLVRQLDAQGLSDADIRAEVLRLLPDTKSDTLGKTIRRVRGPRHARTA